MVNFRWAEIPRGQKKTRFDLAIKAGHITWQRPTLTEPIALLPLALHRFTSVFEMGTGGSNALWSPVAGFGGGGLELGYWGP